jgi:ABC-type dipeptide/oligopeptide/nickel transport system permease component
VIRFALRRLLAAVPIVLGISLVSFVLVNLAVGSPDTSGAGGSAQDRDTAEEMGRAYGLHLPLFVNLSIEDARTRAERDIDQLADPVKRGPAIRSLVRSGGAALPYLAAALPRLRGAGLTAAIEVLAAIAPRLGVADAAAAAPDVAAFWRHYFGVYGSDFTPVRAARLVRRYERRDDQLALAELERLDSFCLPALMEAIGREQPAATAARLVALAGRITGREDALDAAAPAEARERVLERWREWWSRRYDLYTAFEGWQRVTGAVTETRYFWWLSRVVTFDFGVSLRDGQPVRDKILERAPVTLLLSFLALLAAYCVAIPLGTFSAVRRDSRFDRAATIGLFVVYSLPAFWVAMLLVRWFPTQGLASPDADALPPLARVADTARHLVLPVLCLSFVSMAMLARYQRVGMLRVIEQDFMRTARAKGLSRTQAILRHGLRNGVIPVVTALGAQLPFLIGGAAVVEKIFGIHGMGFETFEAIRVSDHPWLVAVITVTAIVTILGIVLADVVYAIVDPRIVPGRRGGRGA